MAKIGFLAKNRNFGPKKRSLSPPQARLELNPSHVSTYLRIRKEPPEVDDTCISWRFFIRICRADNQKWIITCIKEYSPKRVWCTMWEGECLVRSLVYTTYRRVVMKPTRRWIVNQPVPKRTQAVEAWCRLAWQQAPQLWNNRKFHMSQTKHEFQIYWIVHFEERIPKNLETLLFYT